MDNDSPAKAWQESYKAALFETDKNKAGKRIADAERVIVARTRILFNYPNNACAERNALDAALYALSVLKLYRCTQARPNGAAIPAKPQLRKSL